MIHFSFNRPYSPYIILLFCSLSDIIFEIITDYIYNDGNQLTFLNNLSIILGVGIVYLWPLYSILYLPDLFAIFSLITFCLLKIAVSSVLYAYSVEDFANEAPVFNTTTLVISIVIPSIILIKLARDIWVGMRRPPITDIESNIQIQPSHFKYTQILMNNKKDTTIDVNFHYSMRFMIAIASTIIIIFMMAIVSYNKIKPLLYGDDKNNIYNIMSSIIVPSGAIIYGYYQLILTIMNYNRDIRLIRIGKFHSIKSTSLYDASQFIPLYIVYSLFSTLIIVLFMTGSFILIAELIANQMIGDFIYYILLRTYLGVPGAAALILWGIRAVLFKYVKNHNALTIIEYIFMYINIITGTFAYLITRILRPIFFIVFLSQRLDIYSGEGDAGFSAYSALISYDNQHTNPVLLTFIDIINKKSYSPSTEMQNNSVNKKARNRWFVAYTMIKNPVIRRFNNQI